MRALVAWLSAYGCAGWMLSTRRLPMRRRVALAAGGDEAVEALRSRAVACMGRGDFEAAFSAFESLAALAPRDARARSGLGAACSALGDVSAACTHMRRAVALDPSSVDYLHVDDEDAGEDAVAQAEATRGTEGREAPVLLRTRRS